MKPWIIAKIYTRKYTKYKLNTKITSIKEIFKFFIAYKRNYTKYKAIFVSKQTDINLI